MIFEEQELWGMERVDEHLIEIEVVFEDEDEEEL